MEINRFTDWKYPDTKDGKPTKYNWVLQNLDGLKLHFKTDIGAFSYINAKKGMVIKDEVQIGSHCSIYSISTIDNLADEVLSKENCKIGIHTSILRGVTIGRNSLVGANSLVNNDVSSNVIAFCVPAKIVRKIKKC